MQPSNTTQSRRQQWSSILLYGLLVWVLIVCGVLFYASHTIRQLPTGGEAVIGIGPLHIARIAKEAVMGSGLTLSFAFKSGIWLLAIICVGVQSMITIGGPLFFSRLYHKTPVHNRGK